MRWADEDLVKGSEVQKSATQRKSADSQKAGIS